MDLGARGPEGGYPDSSSLWTVRAPDILDASVAHRQRLLGGFMAWLDQLRAPAQLTVSSREAMDNSGGCPGRERVRSVHLRVRDEAASDSVAARLSALCDAEVKRAAALPTMAEGPWHESARGLTCGGSWIECLRLMRFPEAEVEPGWLWELLGEPADLDLTVSIAPKPAAEADRQLRRRLRSLQARALAGDLGGAGPALEASRRSADRLREVLARGEGRLFELAVTLSVGGSPAEVGAGQQRLRQRAAALRARLTPAWLEELPALLESRGLRPPPRPARRLLETREVASLWPWLDGAAEMAPGRYRVGRHRRTGRPVGLGLASFRGTPNGNCCVIATSGGGKSYLAGVVGMEAASRGVLTVVVDPESEHRRWCEAAGGTYLDLAAGQRLGFNVLEAGDPGEAALAALELAALLGGPLSAAEAGSFLEACAEVLAQDRRARPVLGDCLAPMRQRPESSALAARLRPWLEGRPGEQFNQPGRGPGVDGVLGIGLRELPSAWIPGAAWLVSQWLWAWARREPRAKQIIVDEAGLLGAHRCLRELMGQVARRIRKYQGSLLLLTQAAQDLTEESFGELVATNSATVLLGGQGGRGALRLQTTFDLEDRDREWLQRAGRGEFLLVSGAVRVPLRVEARPDRHPCLATSGESLKLGARDGHL
ncbi:MAG: hypothetical protein WBU92_03500 [Candidatus Dormiibacterota bacterium]